MRGEGESTAEELRRADDLVKGESVMGIGREDKMFAEKVGNLKG